MAKQRTENAPPAALWKDTFSDLMNLLLCFFVLMFAMSNIDSQKFEEIAALEEKEREEFTRLKVIKQRKNKAS